TTTRLSVGQTGNRRRGLLNYKGGPNGNRGAIENYKQQVPLHWTLKIEVGVARTLETILIPRPGVESRVLLEELVQKVRPKIGSGPSRNRFAGDHFATNERALSWFS